ncbi:thioredoxin family protein [Texcoconibacillus texcoconensis]|uniref:Thioredoxin n=1 Tax=Texcoconibacillus texcoconensis TaxID=1095777 RepID=A0A840QQV7_9BACI|nr:thioredoxin family protein [Texcoconibacillus texcoconensis]MBB5173740.1 thioredoxin 1 [Texcoconibacillus texcoconensis]
MMEVNKENFDQEVLNSNRPVVVDVWGPNCQPCLNLFPDVEELAKDYENAVKVVKLNSAENRRLCIDLRVMGLPAFLLFKDGTEVKRISGNELTKEDVENLIKEGM